jgi:drug/metabolite transporter (DMT)-like permease
LIYPGLRQVQAGTGAVVIALSPLATYGLAVAQRQEPFRTQGLAGAVIALIGIGIVFVQEVSLAGPIGSLLLIFGGMLCLSEAGVIVKWIPRGAPLTTNAVAMLTAAALLIAVSVFAGEPIGLPTRSATWLAVGYIVVFGSVAMFTLYLFGLSRWTASGMSYSTLLLPFVSVTVATILTGEQFSPAFAAGGIVMLAGVYIGAFGVHRPRRSNATSMPECLPVDDCAQALPPGLVRAGRP